MITTVTNSAQLLKALKSAHSGDTILLAAGAYNNLAISGINFPAGVTIASADPAHEAVLSNLSVTNSSGLNFQQLDLTTTSGTAATITGSSNITFSQDTFSGAASGSGNAMLLKTSTGVTITGSTFTNFGTGINVQTDSNFTITNNTFHAITGGAIRGTGLTTSTISGNTFTDASATNTAHTDVVYLWGTNSATVSNNYYGAPLPAVLTTTAQLITALQNAHAGDVIKLAAGTYDSALLSNLQFSSAVTITSADPNHQAVLTNLTVSNSSGLSFQGVTLGTATGTAATVSGSSNITFTGDHFSGPGGGAGNALNLNNSNSVTVTGSDFGNFGTGINVLTDSNLTITNNTFHGITGGAVRGTGVTNSTISNNTFTDASYTVPTHTDVVYLWQDNTANHVSISGNFYGPPLPAVLTTTAQLIEALQNAHAGDVIHLAAGVYDAAAISGMQFATAVTITSADPAHEAVLTNLTVSNSSGLTFQGVAFGATTGTAATVTGSQSITFTGDTFSGSATGTGAAMQVSGSAGVTVTGSDIGKFATGINATTDSNLSVTNNTFHDITSADVFGAGVTNSTISGNTFANASATNTAHTDVLNLAEDTTANNVTISNNTFTSSTTTTTTPPATTTTTPPTTLTNAQVLLQDLQNAHAGDVIKLAAGTYDGAVLSNFNFASGVTITSADPTHEAVISNLTVSNSSGLIFSGVTLTTGAGAAATITGSNAISFTGDIFAGVGTGTAVVISGSSGVAVTGSDVGNFATGLNLQTDSNMSVTGNNFHGNPGGAIVGSGVTTSVINLNTFPGASTTNTAHTDVINLAQDNMANHVEINGNSYAGAPVVVVSSVQQLSNALATATAGEVIELAAGTYVGLNISNLHFNSAVTLVSQDASHHAVLQDMQVSGSSGLTFADLTVTTVSGTAATINSSSGLVFDHDAFAGPGIGIGNAMIMNNSSGVTVSNSDVGNFWSGINVTTDSNVSVIWDTFHGLTAGGVRGTGLTNSTIGNDVFADASATNTTHSDVIALWQDNTANNVTIANNTYGAGSTSQTTTSNSTTSSSPPPTTTTTSPITTTSPSGSTTVTVSNYNDLWNAVHTATAGETILLAPGTYDNVVLGYMNVAGAGVRITSADPTHQAVINGLSVGQSSGLHFDHLTVTLPSSSNVGIDASNDTNLSFSNMTVDGPAGSYVGTGMNIRASTGITVTNSDFGNLGTGMGVTDSGSVTISHNSFHDLETDGIDNGGAYNEVISNNTFTNFNNTDGTHPDAIQFFSGTSSQNGYNILVEDNQISRGSGTPMQGIYVEHTSYIEIVGNAMAGPMLNGIGISTVDHGLVNNNFVEGYPDLGARILTRNASSDVTIENNQAGGIGQYLDNGAPNPNYVEINNTIIPSAALGDLTAFNAWLAQHSPTVASLSDSFFLH